MNALYQLTKRHMLLYFKDRSAVFFSLLSVLIVLLLMLVFLGDMNKEELMNLLQSLRINASEEEVNHVIILWTIAGILSVNAFTIPITMIGRFIQDKEEHKLENFFTSPLPRSLLIASYVGSAILTSIIMSMIILALSAGYVISCRFSFLTSVELLQVAGVLLLNILVSSSIILLVAQWVHSMNAWGAFSTLSGTLIGFLGGIYLPLGSLSSPIQIVLKSLPFLHETSMLRTIMTQRALQDIFTGQPEVLQGYKEAMGITLTLHNSEISMMTQTFGLALCGIIATVLSIYLLKKHSIFGK